MIKTFFQIYRFIIVGIVVVFCDALFYFFINFYDLTSPEIAKRISFGIGAMLAFYLNKNYVFKSKKKNLIEPFLFIILYITSFLVNGYVHDIILFQLNSLFIAFFIATAASTIMNFIGQKFVIFKDNL